MCSTLKVIWTDSAADLNANKLDLAVLAISFHTSHLAPRTSHR